MARNISRSYLEASVQALNSWNGPTYQLDYEPRAGYLLYEMKDGKILCRVYCGTNKEMEAFLIGCIHVHTQLDKR